MRTSLRESSSLSFKSENKNKNYVHMFGILDLSHNSIHLFAHLAVSAEETN